MTGEDRASFRPADFLALAERLYGAATGSEDQAALRTVVSRAYYAAFLTWREKVRERDPDYVARAGGAGIHAAVRRWLIHRGLARIAQRLSKLRDARDAADYDLDVHFEADDVRKYLGLARELVT